MKKIVFMLLMIVVFFLLSDCRKIDGVPILSISATSAEPAHPAGAAMDGNPNTYWQPVGDAMNEGLTITFAAPFIADSIEVDTGSGGGQLSLYINGSYYSRIDSNSRVSLTGYSGEVSTLFIRNESDDDIEIKEITVRQPHAETFFYAVSPEIVKATVTASSELEPAPAYDPRQLFDGRLDFGWSEGANGNGAGESLTFAFDKPRAIDGIYIANGYQRSEDHFKKNGRVKTVEVYADGKLVQTITLKDSMGYQFVALDAPIKAKTVVLKIVSVYPGSRYSDTVISELKFSDKNRVIDVATDFNETVVVRILSAVKNTVLEDFIDRNLYMNVSLDETGDSSYVVNIKFRSNGSFVIWKDQNIVDTGFFSESSVYDGNWQIERNGIKEAIINIFGKKHRFTEETDWSDPYSENAVSQSTTEIFSDRLIISAFDQESDVGGIKDVLVQQALKIFLGSARNFEGVEFVIIGQTFTGVFPFDGEE